MKIYVQAAAAAKMLPKEYYAYVKDVVSKIAKIPKGDFHAVSSRDRESLGFKPGYVTFYMDGRTWKAREADQEKLLASAAEIKQAFNNNCEIEPVSDSDIYFIRVPQEAIDALTGAESEKSDEPAHDTISFWATTVFDTRSTAVAYGAKIKSSDGWSFPGSLGRIQQRLGEQKFYYFAKGGNKSFKSYASLVKFLKGIDPYINVPDEQEIINAGYDAKYFTH